ncbi:MAG TPA: thioesterase family protein [Rhodospirillales bacterium]|nr:thioesterase family protein [Rhodospirillales bacterium]
MHQTSEHDRWRFEHRETVRPEWVDYNGHMNVAYYVLVFDHATDATLDRLGIGEAYRQQTACSVFVGEMHVSYLQEVMAGDELVVATRLLAADAKRLVLFHEMSGPRLAQVVASNEVLCVHVDLTQRRSGRWPADVAAMLHRVVAGAEHLPAPARSGRGIRLR